MSLLRFLEGNNHAHIIAISGTKGKKFDDEYDNSSIKDFLDKKYSLEEILVLVVMF